MKLFRVRDSGGINAKKATIPTAKITGIVETNSHFVLIPSLSIRAGCMLKSLLGAKKLYDSRLPRLPLFLKNTAHTSLLRLEDSSISTY